MTATSVDAIAVVKATMIQTSGIFAIGNVTNVIPKDIRLEYVTNVPRNIVKSTFLMWKCVTF